MGGRRAGESRPQIRFLVEVGRLPPTVPALDRVEHGAVFFEEPLARAQAMPGAVSAAMSNAPPPPLRSSLRAGFEVEGRPLEPNAPRPPIRFRSVTPHYFETFRRG